MVGVGVLALQGGTGGSGLVQPAEGVVLGGALGTYEDSIKEVEVGFS